MYHILSRVKEGVANPQEVELLREVALGMEGKCLCALGEFAIMPVLTSIDRFHPDFDALARTNGS